MILLYDDYSHFIVLSSHNICILYSMDIAKISMRLENALNRRNKLSAGGRNGSSTKIFLEVMNEEGLFGIIYDGSLNIISH